MLRTSVVVSAALVAALTVATPAVAAPVVLNLPAPTGGHRVGTTSLHLVDTARADPLAPTERSRELMVRLWYPAAPSSRQPVAAYMPPVMAGALTQQLNALLGTDFPADLLTFPTHSRQDAAAAAGRRPVLVFSHGLGLEAALYTGIFEELASRGYVVAGIDHTFDAGVVEFPGERIEPQNPDALVDHVRLLAVRVADTRFVLDRLAVLASGRNPDAGNRPLPAGLSRALDLTKVAGFGHSLGSMTAIGAIEQDRRFDTGAALDGNPLGPASLDRPFLMMGNPSHRRADDPDWAAFYDRLRGPRLHLVIDGTLHNDLTDVAAFKQAVPGLASIFELGPIEGVRALSIQRAYLTAWFDRHLKERPSPLLRCESPQFPEVDFQTG
jgi:hypothetical protein